MADNLTIARPYAKAVFEQAVADGHLEEWDQILRVLAAIASDAQTSRVADSQQLLTLFESVTAKALPQLAPARRQELKNFLMVLITARRLAVLPEILHRYQRLMAAARDLKEVTVISAYPLSAQRCQQMIATLTRYLHSQVTVDFQEDASLIGGAVIRSGNWVMDSSIKGKLQNLRDNLRA